MKKGEIWLINLPFSDRKEQQGKRPAAIIAKLEAQMIMVIPLTSRKRALRFLHVLEVKANVRNGLSEDSIALAFQLRSLDATRLVKKVGILEKGIIKKLDSILKRMLGLD